MPGGTHAPDAANGSEEVPTISISRDDLFHLLQNARRRAVLRYMLEHRDQDRFRLGDVAEAVAAWQYEVPPPTLPADKRQRVYISLYQSHLPKLEEYGVVEYDRAHGVVAPTPLLALFEDYLESTLHTARENLHVEDEEFAGSPGLRGLVDDVLHTIRG